MSKDKTYLIVSVHPFFKKKFNTKKKNKKFLFISKKNELNKKILKRLNPEIIFFPYWHWKISKSIVQNYNCIGFHTAPLPYGRGGSPIQNQIFLGKINSQICAIKYNEIIDGGKVYLRKNIKLNGNANEIFNNIFSKISIMINKLSNKLTIPKEQKGKITKFKRRKPLQSKIPQTIKISKLYDFIRMLDFDFNNFPKSFLKYKGYKYIFSKPILKNKTIKANVEIKKI